MSKEDKSSGGPLTAAERESLKRFLKLAAVFMAVVALTSVLAAVITAWYNGLA